jgi:hypothetical protein
LAKVETEFKSLKDAKNKEEAEKKKITKDMVARWNKDDQGCSQDATK